jgi:hypothetical protein
MQLVNLLRDRAIHISLGDPDSEIPDLLTDAAHRILKLETRVEAWAKAAASTHIIETPSDLKKLLSKLTTP